MCREGKHPCTCSVEKLTQPDALNFQRCKHGNTEYLLQDPLYCPIFPVQKPFMTYASQQLAEALQKLSCDANLSYDYSKRELPASIETEDLLFPAAVADFLTKTSDYTEQTRTVSVGIY